MSDIIKITIKMSTGFWLDRDHAFSEKIIIQPTSIRYKYISLVASEMNSPGFWVYKTNSFVFKELFVEAAEAVRNFIDWNDRRVGIEDGNETVITVTYSDGNKRRCLFLIR